MNKILTMLFATAVVFSLEATVYYASPGGTAEADCLSENTAGDIYTAVSKAKASGDIIQLAEGTYTTTKSINLNVAGITLQGADEKDASKTILQGPGGTTTSRSAILCNKGKKVTIRDLTITGFYRSGKGGSAIEDRNSTSVISADNIMTAENCIFENNIANYGNSAEYNTSSTVYGGTYSNCVFRSNKSKGRGGAGEGGTYIDCYFKDNSINNTTGYGGALHSATALRCVFDGNSARHGGGTSETTADCCVYSNNVSTSSNTGYSGLGAAIYKGTIKNSLIYKNKAIRKEGAIVHSANCINCTIVKNTINTKSFGAVYGGTHKNCIIIDNDNDIGGGTFYNTIYAKSESPKAAPTLTDCIQTTDAKFNAGAKADLPYYCLRASSPARDAGMDVDWTSASVDLRGKKRISGGKVDLGCYEYQTAGFMIRVK